MFGAMSSLTIHQQQKDVINNSARKIYYCPTGYNLNTTGWFLREL